MKQVYNPQHFDKLLDHIRGCASKTPKQAIAYLEGNVVEYLNKKIEASAGQEKRFFEKTHNLVTSYRDGLVNGDIEVKGLRELRADMVQAKSEHEKNLAQIAAKAEAKRLKAEQAGLQTAAPKSPDDQEDPDWLEEWLKGNNSIDHGDEAIKIYKKYTKFKRLLPKKSARPYVAVRVPVVAIPKSGHIPDFTKLQRTGLCDDMLFGYPILKNQVLVGLNNEWLNENFAKETKGIIRVDGKKDIKLDYAGALEKIRNDIKQKTGRSYIFMEAVHSFHSVDLHWAWAVSEIDMRRLAGTLSGLSTFSVNDWTLPFEQSVTRLKGRK